MPNRRRCHQRCPRERSTLGSNSEKPRFRRAIRVGGESSMTGKPWRSVANCLRSTDKSEDPTECGVVVFVCRNCACAGFLTSRCRLPGTARELLQVQQQVSQRVGGSETV